MIPNMYLTGFSTPTPFLEYILAPFKTFIEDSRFLEPDPLYLQDTYRPKVSAPSAVDVINEESWKTDYIVTYLFHYKDRFKEINKWLPKLD